jgi:phage major head subunit gpT-like protein
MMAQREISPGLLMSALKVSSSGYDEKFGWIGAMPGVQEWIGEINAKEFEYYDYTIKNRDFATAVPIFENDFADDRVGALATIPEMLVRRILSHPEKLLIDLITKGTTLKAYDGVAFFSDASGNRKFDNLLAGTGTSLAQLEADLNTSLATMAKFSDDQGEALNIKGSMIVCPVSLENKFRRLVQSETDPTAVAQGTYNPYNGRIEVIGDARLDSADSNDWYLFATNEIVKPFIYQLRQSASPMMEKTPHTKRWIYSANYRGNAGYGLPHLAIKTVNT